MTAVVLVSVDLISFACEHLSSSLSQPCVFFMLEQLCFEFYYTCYVLKVLIHPDTPVSFSKCMRGDLGGIGHLAYGVNLLQCILPIILACLERTVAPTMYNIPIEHVSEKGMK